MQSVTGQKIFRIRRDYNAWVADETLEDYALRYTPRSFRKWSEFRVANTAFGATSFLALEAIGGTIALSYGFSNAVWAILVVGLITFLTGLPISYYAAKYGLDMDLLTRGAGFGYLGSTLTSLIYASFTFIFFALEAAILALALQLYFGWPLPVVLPGQLAGGDPDRDVRHHADLAAAAVDAADLDGAVRLPLHRRAAEEPAGLQRLHQPLGPRLVRQRLRRRHVRRRRDGGLLAGGADRRAGRLPALPAREDACQPAALVGRGAGRRRRAGSCRAC